MRRKYGKEVLQGIFIHDYGASKGPQNMDLLELQTQLICQKLMDDWIQGIVLLQNGWFDSTAARSSI